MNLEDLIAREEIRELIYSYCRAVDALDWEAVMACFSPDAIISHGSYTGPADTFLSFAQDFLNQMTSTIHTPGGIIVEFDGDLAKTNTPFASFHHIAGHVGKVGPVDTGGVDTDWIVSGRYCDTLKKIDGSWKIIKRQAYNDWTRAEPSRPAKS